MAYHINKRGVVAPCRAKNGACPLGGSFDSRSSAKEAADVMVNDFLEEATSTDKDLKKRLVAHNNEIESLKNEAEYISSVREKHGEETGKAQSEITDKLNANFRAKTEITDSTLNKLKENKSETESLDNAKADLDKWKNLYDTAQKKAESENSGNCPKCGEGTLAVKKGKFGEFVSCSNFPKCKHTQKPYVLDKKGYEQQINNKTSKVKIEEQNLERKAEQLAKETPEFKKLEKERANIERERDALKNINSSKNKDGSLGLTKEEKEYETEVSILKSREDKIGINRFAFSSKNLEFGSNEIKEDLVVDSKGKIANLYVETGDNRGNPMKVVKILDNNGGLKLENGNVISMDVSYNWKQSGGPEKPENWRFYTTPTRGRKKYEGNKKIHLNSYDSGD